MEEVSQIFETATEEETKAIGRVLSEFLRGGEVIGLIGELGTGKTTFVMGLAEGLGVTTATISPTFVLVREYEGRLPLFHVDAYRLWELRPDEVHRQIGLMEYMGRGGVVVIEWADFIADTLPPERLDIFFAHTGKGRKIRFKPRGRRYRDLMGSFFQALQGS